MKKLMCVALETVLNVVDEKMESPMSSLPGASTFTKKGMTIVIRKTFFQISSVCRYRMT